MVALVLWGRWRGWLMTIAFMAMACGSSGDGGRQTGTGGGGAGDCLVRCAEAGGDPDQCAVACAPATGGTGAGGMGTGGVGMGGAGTGGAGVGGSGGDSTGGMGGVGAMAGSPGTGGTGGMNAGAPVATALGANTTVGIDWPSLPGATSYRVYWSLTPGVTPQTGQPIDTARPGVVHRSLTNGTPYYYVVTSFGAMGESPPSNEATATPQGEWVLEEFGNGEIDDVLTGADAPKVPVEQRVHVLLHAEGYLASDLGIFHNELGHDTDRRNDVDRWIDLVFSIEPYSIWREAFVVWYLPRASSTHFDGGDTAFAVPVDTSGTFWGTNSIPSDGLTAQRAWEALGIFPFQPDDFYDFSGRAKNHVSAFLLFDPNRGRASVSGRALALRNPLDRNQTLSGAFGVGHAHEFTHAFSLLRDEYLENNNNAPGSWSGTSNVIGSNQCAELPWQHLIFGGSHNPGVDQLVGAFGVPAIGFHSEFLCLLNGTHDNAQYYGGNGLLRVEDRMCNFCRETSAFRIFERTRVLADDRTSHDAWVSSYRTPFYDRFGFQSPAIIPQTNNVSNPASGSPVFEPCVP